MPGGAEFYQRKFTSTTRVKRYLAVHDEIQAMRGRNGHPYLVHGVLFVPHDRIDDIVARLRELRRGRTDVWVEHRDMKKARGLRYEIAERWLTWFRTEGIHFCSFKVFAVDQEGFRNFPYPGDYGYADHIWKNTVTSFVAGIQWSLPKVRGILLDVVCDSSGNADFLAALDRLPTSIKRDMVKRRRRQRERYARAIADGKCRTLRLAPQVRIRGQVRLVPSRPDPMACDTDERELVQLTDLLLGVLWDTIRARQVDGESRAGRRRLSREFSELLDARVPLPWAARLPVARAVSVSLYPDENGRAYPATVLTQRPGQQQMEFPGDLWSTRKERRGLPVNHEAA